MTTYKSIKGYSIESKSSDPTPFANFNGQYYYNTTDNQYYLNFNASGVWSTGGNYPTANSAVAGAGTQTAAVAFGGDSDGDLTAEYDGSTWTLGGNLSTDRASPGPAGTQTSALAVGGAQSGYGTVLNSSDEYNGTSWTAGGTSTFSSGGRLGVGTQTSALIMGGLNLGMGALNFTDEYDGTTYTAGGNFLIGTWFPFGTGTQTACLSFGGSSNNPVRSNNINGSYDGTSWSLVSQFLNYDRWAHSGFGTQTAAVACGGASGINQTSSTGSFGATEEYDGTTWTNRAYLSTPRTGSGGAGTSSLGLIAAGATGDFFPQTAGVATEEYDSAGGSSVIKKIYSSL